MKKRPSDAVNMGALPDTAPPPSRNAPKRKLTREETAEMIRKARGGDRMEMNREYSGTVKRYAKGGGVTRGDGMCSKGHTKGRMI
jgi:hypothetical protein